MAFSSFLINNVLNHVFNNDSYNPPSQLYVGLISNGSEVSGGGYSRQQISFTESTNGTITNDAEVRFPLSESGWGTIDQAAVFTSETGGKALDYGGLTNERLVEADDIIIILENGYKIELE